jgi:hypothetical protein
VEPGFQRYPYLVLDHHLPWYTDRLRAGRVLRLERLPDGLPAEAVHERAYCTQEGMKSHVAIPVTVGGTALGAWG